MFMLAAPSAFGTITYGGVNVEAPALTSAVAVGDSGVLNNNVGGLTFNSPKMATWPAAMAVANNNIVLDPSGGGAFTKYCRAWVFTGVTQPAATPGDAAAEWHGSNSASANEVLNTGDAIVMSATASGNSRSEVHNTGTVGTIATTAQTLIDSWAGSRAVGGSATDRNLFGNAQITSTAQTDTQGSASTGATAVGYTGNSIPQSYAIAGFGAERVTTSTGSTRKPGAINGAITGTTSVELTNTLVDIGGTGSASGYATVNTYAMASASDLPNTQSYALSEIRSNAAAARGPTVPPATTAIRPSTAIATADGQARSEAWDSSRDWAAMTTEGSGNVISSVTGKTVANAIASLAGDNIYGDALRIGPAGGILATRSPNTQVWSGMLSVASKGQSVTQVAQADERDAFTFAYTSARVTRPTAGSISAANAATGAAWLGSASTTDANIPLTADASLLATSQETQANHITSASLSDIGIGSGAHAMNAAGGALLAGQGSTAKLAIKARFNPSVVNSQSVNIGNAGSYPFGSATATAGGSLNGFLTNGPGFTGSGTDDGGSYMIAGSQNAITTGSSGTYSLTTQSMDVREWVGGNTLINNNWLLSRPIPMTWQTPQVGSATPNLQEIPVYGRATDSYQWSGDVVGPS
jgi:hypothetical protein